MEPLTEHQRELVLSGIGVAVTVCLDMVKRNRHLEMDDLLGIAHIGLCKAAKRYDPSRGTFFKYAAWRIKGDIYDELRRSKRRGLKFSNIESWIEDIGTIDDSCEADEFWEEACVGLSQRERTVLVERFRHDQYQKDVAEIIGVSESMVSLIIKGMKDRVQRNLLRDSSGLEFEGKGNGTLSR